MDSSQASIATDGDNTSTKEPTASQNLLTCENSSPARDIPSLLSGPPAKKPSLQGLPQSDLMSRVKAFLPTIAAANEQLVAVPPTQSAVEFVPQGGSDSSDSDSDCSDSDPGTALKDLCDSGKSNRDPLSSLFPKKVKQKINKTSERSLNVGGGDNSKDGSEQYNGRCVEMSLSVMPCDQGPDNSSAGVQDQLEEALGLTQPEITEENIVLPGNTSVSSPSIEEL